MKKIILSILLALSSINPAKASFWLGVTNYGNVVSFLSITGCDSEVTSGDYKYCKVTTIGTGALTVTGGPASIDFIVLGGGGCGGHGVGGGGGGGGHDVETGITLSSGALSPVIGRGGICNNTGVGDDGVDSSVIINSITYTGNKGTGGGNGISAGVNASGNGNSGGAGNDCVNFQGPGTVVSGNSGGNSGSFTGCPGAGGGGGGTVGQDASNSAAGNGGDGYTWIDGNIYGGGGGGGCVSGTFGAGGTGGGGAGACGLTNGIAGTNGLGGGSGGYWNTGNANGGSGQVIIKYKFQ